MNGGDAAPGAGIDRAADFGLQIHTAVGTVIIHGERVDRDGVAECFGYHAVKGKAQNQLLRLGLNGNAGRLGLGRLGFGFGCGSGFGKHRLVHNFGLLFGLVILQHLLGLDGNGRAGIIGQGILLGAVVGKGQYPDRNGGHNGGDSDDIDTGRGRAFFGLFVHVGLPFRVVVNL